LIEIKLREALLAHCARTGSKLTYKELAERTGLSQSTIESIGGRPSYNTSIFTIAKICIALGCSPGDLLELKQVTNSTGGQLYDNR